MSSLWWRGRKLDADSPGEGHKWKRCLHCPNLAREPSCAVFAIVLHLSYIFSPPPTSHLSGLKTELVQALAGGRRYFSCLIDAV